MSGRLSLREPGTVMDWSATAAVEVLATSLDQRSLWAVADLEPGQ
jgi:hypothetical protein